MESPRPVPWRCTWSSTPRGYTPAARSAARGVGRAKKIYAHSKSAALRVLQRYALARRITIRGREREARGLRPAPGPRRRRSLCGRGGGKGGRCVMRAEEWSGLHAARFLDRHAGRDVGIRGHVLGNNLRRRRTAGKPGKIGPQRHKASLQTIASCTKWAAHGEISKEQEICPQGCAEIVRAAMGRGVAKNGPRIGQNWGAGTRPCLLKMSLEDAFRAKCHSVTRRAQFAAARGGDASCMRRGGVDAGEFKSTKLDSTPANDRPAFANDRQTITSCAKLAAHA